METAGLKEHLQDRLALLGVLELVVLEVAREGLLLELVIHESTLACISHQGTTAAADSTVSSRPSPSGHLDVLPSTPSVPRLAG